MDTKKARYHSEPFPNNETKKSKLKNYITKTVMKTIKTYVNAPEPLKVNEP